MYTSFCVCFFHYQLLAEQQQRTTTSVNRTSNEVSRLRMRKVAAQNEDEDEDEDEAGNGDHERSSRWAGMGVLRQGPLLDLLVKSRNSIFIQLLGERHRHT